MSYWPFRRLIQARFAARVSGPLVARVAFWTIPPVLLFMVPLVLWTGVFGGVMNLGGDDSHLMFPYPSQWLDHASIPVLDRNLAGYNPRTFFVPFTVVLAVVKATGLNVEGVIFGATIALTYLGIVRLTLELIGNSGGRARAAAVFAGTVAVCAPLLAETQWTYLLTAIFWQPLLPWLFLLYLWHQRSGKRSLLLVASVVVAVGATAVNQWPWTISCGLLLVGLAVASAVGGSYRFRPVRLLVFGSVIGLTNSFWIVPVLLAPLLHQVQFTAALSATGRADALQIVRAIAPLMSAGDAVGLRSSQAFLQNFNLPQVVPDEWSRSLGVIGFLPLLAVVGGVLLPSAKAGARGRRTMYGVAGLALLFLYLETLRVIPGGVRIFEFLTAHVPGWTAERNFYDKFTIPFVEISALTAGICLYHLTSRLPLLAMVTSTGVLVLALITYDAPFLGGAEFRLPYYGDVSYTRVMAGLPSPYLSMLARIRELPPGAILSLPLSAPAWTVAPSDQGSGVYIGISPIFFLTGRSDYNGVQSFDTPLAPFLSALLKSDLERGEIAAFARVVGELGVRYVVVSTGDDLSHQFYKAPAISDPVVEQSETSRLVSVAAPTLLARYGPYELRELSSEYSKPVVSLVSPSDSAIPAYLEAVNLGLAREVPTESCQPTGPVYVSNSAPDHYKLSIPASASTCLLVLRNAYSSGWKAEVASSQSKAPNTIVSTEIYGFANSFVLPPSAQRRDIELVYTFRIVPLIGTALSVISFLALLAIVCLGAPRLRMVLARVAGRAGRAEQSVSWNREAGRKG